MSPLGILFVCHGNICRSPMAEFVMKDMLERRGLTHAVHVESAAMRTDEIGNDVHWGTADILDREGISHPPRRARLMADEDYETFDLVVAMDSENMRDLERRFPGDPDAKVHRMMEFAGVERDVADPWYTGDFNATYNDIVDGCEGILGWLSLHERRVG